MSIHFLLCFVLVLASVYVVLFAVFKLNCLNGTVFIKLTIFTCYVVSELCQKCQKNHLKLMCQKVIGKFSVPKTYRSPNIFVVKVLGKYYSSSLFWQVLIHHCTMRGRHVTSGIREGVVPRNWGGAVWPTFGNPYSISD